MSREPTGKDRVVLLSVLAALWTVPTVVSAETIHVPTDQPTIQAGIDAAGAGDTVLVAPGTYSGAGNRNLDFGGVDLVLKSEGGEVATFINCNSEFDGNARGFILHNGESAAAVIEGFTVLNCWAPSDPTYGYSGGGMLLIGASPTVRYVVFGDNTANGGSGAGIGCFDGASPLIVNCVFFGGYTNNYGSAIYCSNSAPHIDTCQIEGNTGNGAIATVNADPLIENTSIVGNQGVDSRGGGGLRFATTSDPQVVGCLIAENKSNGVSRGGSGVLLLDTAAAYFLGCTIAGNYSADVGGGFLLASGSAASLQLQECIVWNNCAENGGGEIFLDSATGTVEFTCSDVDASGVDAAGVTYDADTIFDDPLFCNPGDCATAPPGTGDYSLDINSPALAANNACGALMGFIGVGCGDTTPTRKTTWGTLKTLFKDR